VDVDAMRRAVVANHRSWHRRRVIAAGHRIERVGDVELPVGSRRALVMWQGSSRQVDRFVARVRALGFDEIGVAALDADPVLGTRFVANGFGWGWQAHWMATDLSALPDDPIPHEVVPLGAITLPDDLPNPLRGPLPRACIHLGVMNGTDVVGHVAMNPWRGTAGIYAMGVMPSARRQGIGRSLLLRALHEARARGCTNSILNATDMGEPLYREVGYVSLGRGQSWWLQGGPAATPRQAALAEAIGLGRTADLERLQPTAEELTEQLPGGTSPIRLAVVTGRPRMVSWLLNRAPDLARRHYEPFGGTLLHLAAEWGRPEIAVIALAHGTDPAAVDETYRTPPAQWARRFGREDLATLLGSAAREATPGG
jgi:GNAT superfamily N-acetyltransferase